MTLLNVHETELAWALIDVAKPRMNTLERNYVFVTVGAGDIFAGVHQLLKSIAGKQIPLQPSLVMLCRTWLSAYAGHEEYDYLRNLIEGFLMPATIRASAAIRRPPPATKAVPLLTATRRRPPSQTFAETPPGRQVGLTTSTHR